MLPSDFCSVLGLIYPKDSERLHKEVEQQRKKAEQQRQLAEQNKKMAADSEDLTLEQKRMLLVLLNHHCLMPANQLFQVEREEVTKLLKEKAILSSAGAEKDTALGERDAALTEKDVALIEKDAALIEKDAALRALTEVRRIKAKSHKLTP